MGRRTTDDHRPDDRPSQTAEQETSVGDQDDRGHQGVAQEGGQDAVQLSGLDAATSSTRSTESDRSHDDHEHRARDR
jgi:hypothetical protein